VIFDGFMVSTRRSTVGTTGRGDVHDMTSAAVAAVAESHLRAGMVTVFVVGSTAGITTLEFESGVIAPSATIPSSTDS
jgi:thiamine phosphate synthase YjbQ (UPF0047 family)